MIDLHWISIALIVFACVLIIGYFRHEKLGKQFSDKIIFMIKYSYLLSLIIVIAIPFSADFVESVRFIRYIHRLLSDNFSGIFVFSIVLGYITFHFNRSSIMKVISEAKDKRIVRSANTLPYRLLEKVRREGWLHLTFLALIILSGTAIQLNIIGNFYFWTDEVFSFHAAKMILEKGEPLFNSGLYYGRASIYHNLLAFSMDLWGINEFGSRVINVIFNVLTAIIIYFILRVESKKVALLGAYLFMFSSLTIIMTIETRFYTMFTFSFLGMALAYYYAFVEKLNDLQESFPCNILYKLKISWPWLLLFFFFLYLSYNTHNFFFIIIFGLTVFYFLALLQRDSWKTNFLFLIVSISIILFGAYYLTGTINLYNAYIDSVALSWARDASFNPTYYVNLLIANYSYFLLALAVPILLNSISQKQCYFFSILIGGLLIISFQRALQERYMFFLIPFLIIVSAYSIYYLYLLYKDNKITRYVAAWLIIMAILFHVLAFAGELGYGTQKNLMAAHKKMAFPQAMIEARAVLEDDVIIIADHHAAYTLIAYGFNIDYIAVSEKREHLLSSGNPYNGLILDRYFSVPYLIVETEKYSDLVQNNKVLLIARENIKNINGLELFFEQTPNIFINY